MLRTTNLLATGVLLSSTLLATVTTAKSYYPASAPATYHVGGTLAGVNMISCSTCHSGAPQTENNVTTSFGVAFGQRSDDDFAGSLLSAYNSLAPLDSDGDGFSNQQEAFAGSLINQKSVTPALTLPDMTVGDVSAKAIVGGPVSALSLQIGSPAAALGGTVSFESLASLGSTTTDFMLKAGGAQSGATVTFYDNSGAMIPTNTADGAGGANTADGSVNIIVKDEGVFDLYSTAIFVNTAMTRTPTFTPVASPELINPYAQVDPYAVISPTATIDNYAVIDAYAIVDNYTTIGAYAQIGSYAYIAPNVDIYAGIDIYTNVVVDAYAEVATSITAIPTTIAAKNGAGYVSAKFSVATNAPAKLLLGAAAVAGTGDSGTAGGLHCMTTGLGTQGLMFLGLLGTVFLVRRKLN